MRTWEDTAQSEGSTPAQEVLVEVSHLVETEQTSVHQPLRFWLCMWSVCVLCVCYLRHREITSWIPQINPPTSLWHLLSDVTRHNSKGKDNYPQTQFPLCPHTHAPTPVPSSPWAGVC